MSFEIFKTNMTSFFLNTKESDLPTPTIEQEDPNNLGETIEVLDIDAELTKIARKITDEYHLAMASAIQESGGTFRPINPAIYNAGMNSAKELIFAAILAVLITMHKKGAKPSTVLMLPIGAAVIAYWTVALSPGSFLPVPMPFAPPYTAPSPGTLVLFPGNPRPIVKGFKDAFSKYDNERDFNVALSNMLDDIIKGFKDHLATVSGIYVGLVPAGLVLVPTPTTWKGVKVQ